MPRPASTPHVISKIRKALGLTQKQLAAMVGVSGSMIKQVERDERDLSPDLASRIFEATGADVQEIQKGKTGEAFACCRLSGGKPGIPLTKKLSGEWRNRRRHIQSQDSPDVILSDLGVDGLARKLSSKTMASTIKEGLTEMAKNRLGTRKSTANDDELREALSESLNQLIRRGNLLDPAAIDCVQLSTETRDLINRGATGSALNRRLLEDALPGVVERAESTARDEADELSVQVGEVARLLFLAAGRLPRGSIRAIFRAVMSQMCDLCRTHDLGEFFTDEWMNANKFRAIFIEGQGKAQADAICPSVPELLLMSISEFAEAVAAPATGELAAATEKASQELS